MFIIENPSVHYTTDGQESSQSIVASGSDLDPLGIFGLGSPNSLFTRERHDSTQHDPSPLGQEFNINDTTDLLDFHIKPEPQTGFNFLEDPSLLDFDLDDFSKDFEASESLNPSSNVSYHTALVQVPFRNEVSTLESHSRTEDVDDNDDDLQHIPRSLDFLPDMLREVPMYRDLFHHFIHVSADMLVPAPLLYPQNPFKILLPAMALETPHLLALILAFAASHRANYLRLPRPADVLGRLLSRVFQGLTKSLENEKEAVSDSTLTTAIMLSSYEILTDSLDSSWKKHLHGARDIVVARGGRFRPLLASPDDVVVSTPNSRSSSFADNSPSAKQSIHDIIAGIAPKASSVFDSDDIGLIGPKPLGLLRKDLQETDIAYFLIRWFAYIDVIGALSSSHASAFLTTNENMAQLWAVHDWSIARIKERGIETMLNSTVSDASQFEASEQHNFPVKVDFLLGVDLDMLPVFSKVTYLVRQRKRLNQKKERRERQHLSPAQAAHWLEEYSRMNQQITSEAYEVRDLIVSFCEAYELRRKQYVNTSIGQLNAAKRRRSTCSSSDDSPEFTADFPTNLNLPPDIPLIPLQVQTYSHLCVMNTTFCYSAVMQLYRRVLELPRTHELVQGIVRHVTKLLDLYIPVGSAVESCMSFPIFTTACEVLDAKEREKYWLRMKGMERFGVGQVHKARRALELTWEKNANWVEIMEENGWEFVLA